jgi:uncharacterized protein
MVGNPFDFETPLEHASDLAGRERELAELAHLTRSGTYTLVEAPRRYGKTSLLKAAAELWRENEQGLAVHVDFSEILTIEEAARRVRVAYEQQGDHGHARRMLSEALRSVRVRLGPVEIGPLASPSAVLDHAAGLHELLELPVEVAKRSDRRAVVYLDEFQDVLAVPGLDGLLRSHIQHHGSNVTYVFAGSEPSMLRELFSDRSRPLYGQAHPFRLGRISTEALFDRVARRFSDTGKDAGDAGAEVVLLGAGHPQRTILLAWRLWELTTGGPATRADATAALAATLRARKPELDAAWRAMTANERRVAIAVAHGLAPTGARAQRATGIATRSAAQQSLRALLERGDVERSEAGQTTLVDPLLAARLRQQHDLITPA